MTHLWRHNALFLSYLAMVKNPLINYCVKICIQIRMVYRGGPNHGYMIVVYMPVSLSAKSAMLKDRDWWRHTLYYRSHFAPNPQRVGEECGVGTGSDRNRKWSEPEVIETGSDGGEQCGLAAKGGPWVGAVGRRTVRVGNRKWSKPEVIGTGSDRNRKWSEQCEVVTANSAGWCSSHLSHVNGASGDTRWWRRTVRGGVEMVGEQCGLGWR